MAMSSTPTAIVTLVRHGESMDNLRSVWAGWKDAPLSVHGMNQARALGESFASLRFTAIHASPLKRAYSTAEAIYENQAEPKPSFTSSLLLREQHFGVAEGNPWIWEMKPGLSTEEHFAQGLYPVLSGRTDKFPDGESLLDVAARAEQAVQELVLPHVRDAAREGKTNVHIAVVSHGIAISELIPALLSKDASGNHPGQKYRGLLNTAWVRINVTVKGAREGEPMPIQENDSLPLEVKLTDFNRSEHLEQVTRQKGGIGSSAFDPKQQDIRAFFGGGVVGSDKIDGRSESNAHDEVDVQLDGNGSSS